MGNLSSVFYPDNPHRHDRAQQLSDDCKYAQQQYNSGKTEVETELGPYKDKLEQLLAGLGCENLDALDALVQSSATGAALVRWNSVKDFYDESQTVDQVIMGAEGVVAIAGIVISAVGAFAGGFGFFAGLGVTADIELALGVFGAIFDAIDGAVIRSKLRDAINALAPARLKMKYAQEMMGELVTDIPTIKLVYDTCASLGYNQDLIKQTFQSMDIIKDLQASQSDITYLSVAQQLDQMDGNRDSWTNEDPDVELLATTLDEQIREKNGELQAENMLDHLEDSPDESFIGAAPPVQPALPLPRDGHILLRLTGGAKGLSPALQGVFHVELESFPDNDTARVRLYTQSDLAELVPKLSTKAVELAPTSASGILWDMRLVDPQVAQQFPQTGEEIVKNVHPEAVDIYVYIEDLFLTSQGELTEERGDPSAEIKVSYSPSYE